jgi:hypothetical protein
MKHKALAIAPIVAVVGSNTICSGKCRCSVEFIKDVSSKMIHFLNTLESDGKLSKLSECSSQFIQVIWTASLIVLLSLIDKATF